MIDNYIENIKEKFKSPEIFRQEYLGNWIHRCSVHNNKGEYCPDEPVHYFKLNDKTIGLCKRCYKNYINGYYDKHRNKTIPKEHRLYL